MSTNQKDQRPATSKKQQLVVPILALAALVIGAALTAGALFAKYQHPQETPEPPRGPQIELPKDLKGLAEKHFRNWPAGQTPELVLVISGEQHNYLQPCGCTRPLYGGLERRYNLLETLRKNGLQVAAIDLGDLYYEGRLREQDKLKYRTSMKALSLMKYDAIGIGREDFKYPLLDGLSDTVLNEKYSYRLLAANIQDKEANYPAAEGSMIGNTVISKTNLKIGVVGTIGQSVGEAIVKGDPSVKLGANPKVLPAALQAIKDTQKKVLLYQGSFDEAKKIPDVLPDFDVIVCLSVEAEPPAVPTDIVHKDGRKTQIIRVGHKGRNIGVLSFFKNGDKHDAHYDLVLIGEEFETPRDQLETNPLVQLMENYTKEVRAKDFRGRFAQMANQHPLQADFPKLNVAYVGSEKCKDCHKDDYKVWDNSRHSTAFVKLENARKPELRQYDPECVICHTTGYGYKTGFVDEKKTEHLLNVGCESCHGPGSMHVNKPKDPALQLAMSPWKRKPGDLLPDPAVELAIDRDTCQKCHDVDNDPYFKFGKFWPNRVAHGKGVKKPK